MGATSISGKVEALPLVRERRPLSAVKCNLEHAETEDRALEPDRRQRNPDLLEQVLFRKRRDLARGATLDELGQHRRRRLGDRAAATFEADLLDRLAVGGELDRDRDLVAAERVLALCPRIRVGKRPVAARVLVVVEDDLAVELVIHGYDHNSDSSVA